MIKYICFYPDGKQGIFSHIEKFFNKYMNPIRKILIIGPYIRDKDLIEIKDDIYDIKILLILEPIRNFEKYSVCSNIINNYQDYNLYLAGCINNDIINKKIKFPLYILERLPIYESDEYFNQANNFIKNTNVISKKYCCLINSWDPDGHRTKMYNTLNKLGKIDCPSGLLNNCSNVELNRIGKPKYMNNYKFNICSENYDNGTFEGYITEKLMDCCLGGAIPIYAGWFDEYDAKIFNKDRIIFYNSRDELSFEKVRLIVKELLEDENKLISFYKQPIFKEDAFEIISKFKQEIIKL